MAKLIRIFQQDIVIGTGIWGAYHIRSFVWIFAPSLYLCILVHTTIEIKNNRQEKVD